MTQDGMWGLAERIGEQEGRLDVCVASAGVVPAYTPSFEYTEESFQRVRTLPALYRLTFLT